MTRKVYQRDAETGKMVRVQLKSRISAAVELGIPKKTLDDYILHVRYGKLFGYDFHANRASDISQLRRLVKEARDRFKRNTGEERMSSKSVEEYRADFDFLSFLEPPEEQRQLLI
uniref:Uncharacterized protein n=1 Tax=Strombidium rassoulzadegani TaxID=1082188 RepID=A0A7S3CNT4_9SPIT|mmetsp:Transcript_18999/g.32458  ORF Transcript_18999/g.32458 Transcript_18999/m.32458 type:complete len:115 (+) Transcript_18999:678-1022(+)